MCWYRPCVTCRLNPGRQQLCWTHSVIASSLPGPSPRHCEKAQNTHSVIYQTTKVSNSIGQTGCPYPVRCHEYHSQKFLSLTTGPLIPHTVSCRVINKEARVRFNVGLVVGKVVSSRVQQPVLTSPPTSVLICNWVLAQQD